MTPAAWAWRRLLRRTTVVAVTGSLGKTTTRELLHAVFGETAASVRTARNLNLGRHRGPQRTLLATRPWHRYCVVELGIERPGDMAEAARLVRPDVAVMLNVARCHTRSFPTLEALAAEKARLFEHVVPGGIAVLNVDYPEIAALRLPAHLRRVEFEGWRGEDETRAADGESRRACAGETPRTEASHGRRGGTRPSCRVLHASSVWPDRLSVELCLSESPRPATPAERAPDERRVRYATRLVGEHWANAVAATVATARALSIPHEAIAAGLEAVPNWTRRLEPIRLRERGATYVRDEYNSSVETLRSSLSWLRQARGERRVVIHGDASDMVNPGRDRTRARRLVELTAAAADHVVPITAYADSARRGAEAAGLAAAAVTPVADVGGAIEWARRNVVAGDVVLCKGRDEQKLGRVYLGLFGEVSCRRERCDLKLDCAECPKLGFAVTPGVLDGSAPLLSPRAAPLGPTDAAPA